jgi:nitrite reductase/ring-hydroxylating ferredoxin subunit
MSKVDQMHSPSRAGRAPGAPMPIEGASGLFSQSWFPICESSEVGPGEIIGRDFLDGQVIVVRSRDGRCSVMSAYCAHVGANLKVGSVVDDQVQCAFHCWRYDLSGRCVATGAGDPPPPAARIFKFPTLERWGLVWAFNGEQPLFELPAFAHPESELVYKLVKVQALDLDPWVVMCNTLDLQHLKIVHGMNFAHEDPDKDVVWTDHSVVYDVDMTRRDTGISMRMKLGIFGTNIFYRSGMLSGRYIGSMTPCALIRPGHCQIYLLQVTTRGDGSEQALREADEFLDRSIALSKAIIAEDEPILRHIKFSPGYLTRSDRQLGKFLDHLRRYPRAHPSSDYIR